VAAVALAHGGAVNGAFHYDDFHAIVDNPAVQTWDPIAYFRSSKPGSGWVEGASYRPITVTSFALNVLVGGMTAGHFLLVNLVLHTAIAWLVYLIGRRLLRARRWAAVAALVFAVHPLNAEAVNYAVARSSLLAAALALVACWALLKRNDGMRGALWIAITAYGLALLSKESAVALLPPVLLMGWLAVPPRGGGFFDRRDLWVSGAFSAVTALFVLLWRAMSSVATQAPGDAGAAYPFWAFLEIVTRGVGLWIWPWPLGLDHPIVFERTFDAGLAAVCAGVVGLLAGLVVWSRARQPVVAWSVVWVGSGFLPLLPLPWLTSQGLFQENRLGFAAVGLAWVTAWLAQTVFDWAGGHARRSAAIQGIGIGVFVLGMLGAIVIDRERSWVWADDARLWEEVVQRRSDDALAFTQLGSVYYVRGALDSAEQAFQRALALDPDTALASLSLGLIAMQQGRWDEATVVFTAALDRGRGDPQDLQKIRLALAAISLRQNDLERAQALYEDATREDATDFRAWYNLGVVAEQRGLIDAAEDAYQRALALSPNEPQIAAALSRVKGARTPE
jgi:Flp pilus assembly protein TadD